MKLALVLKELNAKRLVGHKSDRLDLIIDWLKALNDVPTMEAKLELKEQANLLKKRNKELPLLEAINAYFDNKGGVYVKPNEMAVVTFKSIPILEELIIPFFLKYPLLSAKSYEFEKWCDIVKLLPTQNHIGKTLTDRDAFLDIAKLISPSKPVRLMKATLTYF